MSACWLIKGENLWSVGSLCSLFVKQLSSTFPPEGRQSSDKRILLFIRLSILDFYTWTGRPEDLPTIKWPVCFSWNSTVTSTICPGWNVPASASWFMSHESPLVGVPKCSSAIASAAVATRAYAKVRSNAINSIIINCKSEFFLLIVCIYACQ